MNKTILRLVLVGLCVTFVSACEDNTATVLAESSPTQPAAKASPPAFRSAVVSPMVRVRRDEPLLAGAQAIELHAARGEGESAQVLLAADTPLGETQVKASALTGPDGASFAPEVRRIGFVPITKPTPGGFGKPGEYADPLLPLEPFALEPGKLGGVWYTAWVPRDAAPGKYTGTVTIQPAQGESRTLPVRLTVYPAVLPKRSELKSMFLLWGSHGRMRYGETWEEIVEPFREMMLRYRMTAPPALPWDKVFSKNEDGTWAATWDEFDQAVETELERGATFFRIGGFGFPWYGSGGALSYEMEPDDPAEMQKRKDRATKLALLDEHLVEKGWTDRFALYLYDEPIISANYPKKGDRIGPDNVEKTKHLAKFIHDHAPNIRTMYVTCDPNHENVATDFPAYIWTPHINHFHPEFQMARRAADEQNWMYTCITTTYVPEFPDIWRIDRTGTAQRATGWWLWRYDCDGTLFWCVNQWSQDVYKNPMYGSDSQRGNGEGFFFYPDPEGKALPYPSIRAELIRDGFEDYDLLRMLQARQAENTQTPHANVLDQLDVTELIRSTSGFSQNPTDYESRHRRVLERLE